MRIVTSGAKYIDIDAYAGCTAYAELLNLQGEEVLVICTAPLNESISDTVLSWGALIKDTYEPSKNDDFILIDISDPEQFDRIVNHRKISEVIDHHPGFENYWQNKIGDRATIEFIGSVCTIIYERWKMAGLLDRMSVISARLLVCGILDNTLNFGAKITTLRDIKAYKELLKIAKLPDDFTSQYFTECQNAILEDLTTAIQNDTKILSFRTFEQPVNVGQLTTWDSDVLTNGKEIITQALSTVSPDWFMNLINISEGKSYFITDNTNIQSWLEKLLKIEFRDDIAIANRLWLRKEIIKQDIQQNQAK